MEFINNYDFFLKIDDDDPFSKSVCRACVDRVVGFDEFYKIVLENQKSLRNMQPTIIFRDDASDKITDSTSIEEYAIMEEAKPVDGLKNPLPNQNINASEMDTPADELDTMSCSSVETETDANNDIDAEHPTNTLNDSELKRKISGSQEFPTELIRDNKLIFHGRELMNLIEKFYTLSCDQCPM